MTLSLPTLSSLKTMFEPLAPENDALLARGAELVTTDGRPMPLTSARLSAEAGGGLARYVLEQTFENPYDDPLHVTYKMPLPVDGAVSGYAFRVGERTIAGTVMAKEAARERFERAIVDGKTAALLEQERPDIFSQVLGNVPPRATIVARITIDQRLAWLPEGQWEMRFPTVIGARYVSPADAREDARAVHLKVAEHVPARLHVTLRITDALAPGARVESPSHALAPGDGGGSWSLATPEGSRLDRDLVVRWSVAQPEVGATVTVARPPAGQPHAGQAYGLCTIVPPSPEAGCESHPRDLIVLFDTSGSMGGEPIALAKRVIASVIDSLDEHDRLELIEFSTRPHRYAKAPVSATPKERAKAIAWARSRSASGGTEMYTAVLEALRALRPGAQRQVVLVTDGYIGGEQRIVELCHERLPEGCRLHVVGVGSAANRTLSESLARAGRGAEILVGPGEDAERAAKRLLERTVRPILTDVTISGDALIEHAPEHVPDVFAGAPLRAVLKLDPAGGEIVVRGRLARGSWEKRVQVPAVKGGEGNQAVCALFAREFVADLEVRWTLGRELERIDRTIERAGVVFQIATRRTSWVAIDDRVSVEPGRQARSEHVPQEIPYGTSIEGFGLSAPAASFASMEEDEMVRTVVSSARLYEGVPAPAPAMPRPASPSPPPPPRAVAGRGAAAGGPPPPSAAPEPKAKRAPAMEERARKIREDDSIASPQPKGAASPRDEEGARQESAPREQEAYSLVEQSAPVHVDEPGLGSAAPSEVDPAPPAPARSNRLAWLLLVAVVLVVLALLWFFLR